MRIDLFNVSAFWGDIDPQKIIFKNSEVRYKFFSKTKTLRGSLTPASERYLVDTVVDILKPHTPAIQVKLNSVWENIYSKGDFEDTHIHPHSHMSFIVYKKGMVNTVLYAPYRYLHELTLRTSPIGKLYPWYAIPQLKIGQILLFPSFLEHMVRKVEVDSGTLSGDLIIENPEKTS